jgi:hypothetical protein
MHLNDTWNLVDKNSKSLGQITFGSDVVYDNKWNAEDDLHNYGSALTLYTKYLVIAKYPADKHDIQIALVDKASLLPFRSGNYRLSKNGCD